MRRLRALLLLSIACLAGSTSFAGDRIGIGVKVGTLGVGVDLTGRANNWLSFRGTVNAVNLSQDYSETDAEYHADVDLGAYGLLVDFHPFKGNFRLSAGILGNRNQIDLLAEPTTDIEIGDNIYTPAEAGTLTGEVRFKETVPYFGIGFGSAAKGPGRVNFVLDVGVLQQGSGDVAIESSSGLVLPSDLEQEESSIESDIEGYKLWPVLAFGISFRI